MGPTSFLRSGKMSQQGGEFIFVGEFYFTSSVVLLSSSSLLPTLTHLDKMLDGHCVFAHR
jgi:hypothetical protein